MKINNVHRKSNIVTHHNNERVKRVRMTDKKY